MRWFPLLTLLLLAPLATGCADPFAGDTLTALPVEGEPSEAEWDRAVPLRMEVWKGNVHLRPEVVALDQETSHKSTAACHHGTDNSAPVQVEVTALWSPRYLYFRVRWQDPTRDEALGWWEREGAGWVGRADDDDGVGILWGIPGEEGHRCQRNCHMEDVGLRDRATLLQMKMRTAPAGTYDLWRWRAASTAPFASADDMAVGIAGRVGDAGQTLPREQEPPPAATGASAPRFLPQPPTGREADVAADSAWEDGWWTVTFRRALETGDPADLAHREGETVPFGVAVFDHTSLEHHVATEPRLLRLGVRGAPPPAREKDKRDDQDFLDL